MVVVVIIEGTLSGGCGRWGNKVCGSVGYDCYVAFFLDGWNHK